MSILIVLNGLCVHRLLLGRRLRPRPIDVFDTLLQVFICLTISVNACALDIVLSYSGGFENRSEAVRAMEQAATTWESVLRDPIVVEIAVREATLRELNFAPGGSIGNTYQAPWSLIRELLTADATSTNDRSSVAHLPPDFPLKFKTWDVDRNTIINDGNDLINNSIFLSRANLRALGYRIEFDDPEPDARILRNEFFLDGFGGFDFDRSDGIVGFDFTAAAIHEIGHAMGFRSGVDDVDFVFADGNDVTPKQINDFPVVTVLDLFRYSAESLPLIDLQPGGFPHFSIDGGTTKLSDFATGVTFGDQWEASHWRESTGGVMDPSLPDGSIQNLTRLDVQALDVIGWDVSPAFFGDFDGDGSLIAADIDALSAAVRAGDHPTRFDLNLDQRVDDADRTVWIHDLKRTYFGDANLDGQFNSADLIAVFAVGSYESGASAEWQDGDWNGDGQFDTRDFVVAFAEGAYEIGPRPAPDGVPEPTACSLLFFGLIGLAGSRRPSLMSRRRTVLSPEAEARLLPSGLKANKRT
jgi:hypothetical protein